MVEYQKIWKKSTQIGMKDMKLVQYSLKDIMCCNIIRIKVIFMLKRHRLCKPKNFLKDSNTLDSIPWS
jgi:hypothetical protein